MGALTAAAMLGPLCRVSAGQTLSLSTPLEPATATGQALGTQLNITALHADRATASRAAEQALQRVQQIDALMSVYRDDSQVGILNRTGDLASAHPFLLKILEESQLMSRRSQGAFDITVQPLWDLYAAAKTPSEDQVRTALTKVDYRKLKISGQRITLPVGMAITLNGIAQGFAADQAMQVLREHGIQHALVDTGELSAIGHNTQDKPWSVGIQHPRRDEAYLALAKLDGRCLATSGDYATTFTPDRLNHHIFDPATGHSPHTLMSASVVAPTACLADAMSTAIFVLGPERGLALAKSEPGVDLLLVTGDGRQITTNNFPLA
jgi:thiamine biosynthesis lipoprotein